MQLQNCVFPNFDLQILSSKSNLRSSFTNLFNFKFSKTCWKSPKLYKRSLTHFQKMSLARWFWAFFFFEKKKVFCLVKWAKTNAFSSIGKMKMKADKTAKSFPTYRIVGKDSAFLLSSILPIEEKAFVLAYFTRQNTFFKKKQKKTLKINTANSFFQNEPKLFYIISDFFNKFLKTWSWTSWQTKRTEIGLRR